MEMLRTTLGTILFTQTTALASQIQALGVKYKLALAEFAVPALRQYSLDEYTAFDQTVQRLIESDGAIELFEYALMKMVARQLRAYFEGPDLDQARYGQVRDVLPECALVLSALAHVGQDDEAEARRAFANGLKFLDAPGAQIQFVPRNEWDLARVDAALARLAKCPGGIQRNILLACGKTVASDGHVTEREAELLRAIADSLDCPMPPFVSLRRHDDVIFLPLRRSVAVPGHSCARTATRFRQSGTDLLCHIAAPGGRPQGPPADGGELPRRARQRGCDFSAGRPCTPPDLPRLGQIG